VKRIVFDRPPRATNARAAILIMKAPHVPAPNLANTVANEPSEVP
jgi:hypothetical protein